MSRKKGRRGGKGGKGISPLRKLALKTGFAALFLVAMLSAAGAWFVHHPRRWIEAQTARFPAFVTAPLMWAGNPVADVTDALGLTGHDAVYEYDIEAPAGSVAFAGLPRRTGAPAPDDIVVLDRGCFVVGWSPKLRHPAWVAYHVPADVRYEIDTRPGFAKDKSADNSPPASSYGRSGYDRGHMAPNHAIASRFGADAQKQTFLMSNIAPQSPSLNRGVWREIEHRIADFWTANWGEIWVVVGCISENGGETIGGTDIDVPRKFYQVVVAQKGMDVRAFAVLIEQEVPGRAWPARYLVSIDELERLSGMDFLPDLPDFIQSPLESELPSRLWPVRKIDVFRQLLVHFN